MRESCLSMVNRQLTPRAHLDVALARPNGRIGVTRMRVPLAGQNAQGSQLEPSCITRALGIRRFFLPEGRGRACHPLACPFGATSFAACSADTVSASEEAAQPCGWNFCSVVTVHRPGANTGAPSARLSRYGSVTVPADSHHGGTSAPRSRRGNGQ